MKILFPTDFTEQSIHVLKEIVSLNQKLNYELIILHAYSRPHAEGFDQGGKLDQNEKNVEKHFNSLTKEIPQLSNQKHTFKKVLGDVLDSVIYYVEHESIGLIVMSTKGAVGIGELFGTKTAKIIKSVNIPVMVVPKDATLMPVNKVGLACDYSEETSLKKLDLLTKLAETLKFELDLITLNRDEKTMTVRENNNRDSLKKSLGNIAHTSHFVTSGNVEWGLIKYARSNDLNMVVVIPKSYNFIERIFHESLTQEMAFHSPVPVLVLK
ncbi:universal stress protein [Ekhidna sp.]|uniref:universal stress protein n=1 Tax=Ekhidna sp. TaxID=2608089 RepID=UPI003B51315E